MYSINNVQLRKPTSAKWVEKKDIGESGLGNPIYGTYSNFELRWDFLTPTEFQTIGSLFEYSQNSGSVVALLPAKYSSTFVEREYSGCYLMQPEVGEYFEGYYSDVVLVVSKVRA